MSSWTYFFVKSYLYWLWPSLEISVKPTSEKMWAGLPQFDRLLVQFARAATGPGYEAVPHGLDTLLAVWVQEDDDGIPLRVVQSVHGFGSHIQQSVTVLKKQGGVEYLMTAVLCKAAHFSTVFHTCSMICLMVFSLTTPEDFSLPASLGSVSARGKTWFTIQELFILKPFQCLSCSPHTFHNTVEQLRAVLVKNWWFKHLLATTNSFGMSAASFSFTASEMGPNITTGLLKPAEWNIKPDTNKKKSNTCETAAWLVDYYFG